MVYSIENTEFGRLPVEGKFFVINQLKPKSLDL